MTKPKFVISNDLWSTEIGEYVTRDLLGIPPKYQDVEWKIQKPSPLPGEHRYVNSGIWRFELRLVVLGKTKVTLWCRVS